MSKNNGSEGGERGRVEISAHDCKGCGLCVSACAVKVIGYADYLNAQGYKPVVYFGKGCTGCGICFYVCPEPGAITVYKQEKTQNLTAGGRPK
jgi:NAD-dependent dihydropyrimidine dehydrogenase PreA subunit